ncbi:MAG: ABC transporter permease [Verrucomicrobia bacterium]|nr:ABC transporter permease [Verrucomicrobiota bacterium]
MTPSLYLALAYLKPKRHLLSVINVLAVTGTMLGVAVLVIVISVMNGFDSMWKEKILSFHPHVSLFATQNRLAEDDPLIQEIAEHPDVLAVSPFILTKVMGEYRGAMIAPFLRGVNPEEDFLYQQLASNPEYLVDGTFELGDEEALIGLELARTLGVRSGDVISVISPSMFSGGRELRLPVDLRIAGVFSVGMFQVDNEFLLTDLQTARDVIGADDGIDGLQVLGRDLMRAEQLAEALRALTDYRLEAMSWMRMNQVLFNALSMEKNMMFFLLAVISIVASFLISSTLIMVGVQKTQEIGLLKSMGFRNGTIMGVFMWYGLIEGLLGIAFGVGTGLLVLEFRQEILDVISNIMQHDVLPAELYFLNELPSETRASDIFRVVGLVLALCLMGGSVPAWLAARKNPVEAMRHVG